MQNAPVAAPTLKYSHEAMIDLMLQEPTVTHAELATVFGYSTGWVSRVVISDAFRARMAQRRKELIDPIVAATLDHQVRSVTLQSLAVMEKKLEHEESPTFAVEVLGVVGTLLGRA